MTIPPFVKLEHDAATRKAYVTVEDREVRKQREMWGMILAIPLQPITDFMQAQLAPIFRTTFSAYQKDIRRFSD